MAEMNIELRIREIRCHKTTEEGHDEVVMLVTRIRPDGSSVTQRFPNPDAGVVGDADNGKAWDLNDSGDKTTKNLHDVPIVGEPLENGQTLRVVFTFIEDDLDWANLILSRAGDLAAYVATAFDPASAPAAKSTAQKVSDAIRAIIPPQSPHDPIGSYGIDLLWNGGPETVNALSFGEHSQHDGGGRDPQGPGRLGPEWEWWTTDMKGSRSHYRVDTYLRMTRAG